MLNLPFRAAVAAALLLAIDSPCHAFEIEIRYDLDDFGFFNDPAARAAIEAAADFYSELIADELGAIDPALFPPGSGEPPRTWLPTYLEPLQGDTVRSVPGATNLIVPADTVIIYVGSRNVGATARGGPGGIDGLPAEYPPYVWANQLFNRGEPGALRLRSNGTWTSNPTDFAPWGGVVFFGTSVTQWNFSTTDSTAAEGIDFLPVALHEIGHVLGLGHTGAANSSWQTLIQGTFTGPLSLAANSNQTLWLADGGWHWWPTTASSSTIHAFGVAHGTAQAPLMVPSLPSAALTAFTVPTDLEVAALQDIGWDLAPPWGPSFTPELSFVADVPTLAIPTSTGFSYTIERSTSLPGLAPIGAPIAGNGSVQSWSDPNSADPAAFYRVHATRQSAAAPTAPAVLLQASGSDNGPPGTPPAIAPGACSCCFE